MLHMRHPYEMGGAYWLFNMVYTQISIFAVLRLGSTSSAIKGASIQPEHLWAITISLVSLWFLSIVMLLIFSEKGFRHTFYKPTRAWEYNRALFDTGIDEYRMFIFGDHPQ